VTAEGDSQARPERVCQHATLSGSAIGKYGDVTLSLRRLTSSSPFPILPEETEQTPNKAGSNVSLNPSTTLQDPTQTKHHNLLQGKCLS
jgi:hypothetical protein